MANGTRCLECQLRFHAARGHCTERGGLREWGIADSADGQGGIRTKSDGGAGRSDGGLGTTDLVSAARAITFIR